MVHSKQKGMPWRWPLESHKQRGCPLKKELLFSVRKWEKKNSDFGKISGRMTTLCVLYSLISTLYSKGALTATAWRIQGENGTRSKFCEVP